MLRHKVEKQAITVAEFFITILRKEINMEDIVTAFAIAEPIRKCQGRRHVLWVGGAGLHKRAQNTKKAQSKPLQKPKTHRN